MTTKEAIKILERLQEPEAWEPQLSKDAYTALQMAIDALQMVKVLADVLDGCPLTQPCDKLWNAHGHWCMNHCADGQTDPDAECWIKYAEVMVTYDPTGSD